MLSEPLCSSLTPPPTPTLWDVPTSLPSPLRPGDVLASTVPQTVQHLNPPPGHGPASPLPREHSSLLPAPEGPASPHTRGQSSLTPPLPGTSSFADGTGCPTPARPQAGSASPALTSFPTPDSFGSSGLGTGLQAGRWLGSCRWKKTHLEPYGGT